MPFDIKQFEYARFEEIKNDFVPNILNGNVFHITNEEGYRGIIKDGIIKNNKNKNFEYIYPQSEGNFGTRLGYICLFDLRDKTNIYEKNIDFTPEGNGYHLLLQYLRRNNLHIFILEEMEYCKLINWQEAKHRKDEYDKEFCSGNYNLEVDWVHAPYYECWYPNDINLSLIKQIVTVSYIEENKSTKTFIDISLEYTEKKRKGEK